MKIKWSEKYNTIAAYSIIVISISMGAYMIMSQFNGFKGMLGQLMSVFTPITVGFVLAYLLNFILKKYVKLLESKTKLSKGKVKFIGIVLTYLSVIIAILLFMNFIFPQFIASIIGLATDIPKYIEELSKFVTDITEKFSISDHYKDLILSNWKKATDNLLTYVTGLLPQIATFTSAIFTSITNLVLGVIISVYVLIDQEKLKGLAKKIINATTTSSVKDRIYVLVHRFDTIFGDYLGGQMLDAGIVGLLNLAVMLIFNIPYAFLIWFIVTVTNIIPFFGPLLGLIPSFFIVFFVSAKKAILYLILSIIIQQIDGNIIGPRILGRSLGISPLWILFSLLVFGNLLGFIGLLIGVPLFALLYSIVKDIIEARLKQKGLPLDTEDYI
ncbi:MAG: AI-2E family transporter [Erysipelothrix sp.]|nr:AI-2E family transporter [Erysipelothrix sp.]